ncbi:SH3 domain-containing protein [Pelagibacterium luteolum]|uniref:SH3-like domain-containing protein n=1 Tax=Pelagibacterium luteolum TaxID=440168 RepID=A0A1G7SQL3_9HYPH|nr:SH3 domain-containing protein [Pelagibacterium luteolum]SDG24709.1 SH3-like domain-containing protein [Pelagibacterium luteolum]
MGIALHLKAVFRSLIGLVLVLAPLVVPVAPVVAQGAQVGQSSGLPIPRFVSIRNAPTNVRVGPGTNYMVVFTFLRPGVPVEITAEFDTWRRIRDVEGDEGWVHQNLVVGERSALITPWQTDGTIALRTAASATAPVRAWLSPNMLVTLRQCDGQFCEIRFTHADEARNTTYQGFVGQEYLWGAYEGEVFN